MELAKRVFISTVLLLVSGCGISGGPSLFGTKVTSGTPGSSSDACAVTGANGAWPPQSNHLIYSWAFHQTWTDSVGGLVPTTTLGAPAYSTFAKVGGHSALFTAANSDGLLINNASIPNSQITIAVWVYLNSLTVWGTFIKNWGSTGHGAFHFGLDNASGQVSSYVQQSDGTVVSVVEAAPATTGSWMLYVFTEDGTNLNLYRNGVSVGSSGYDGTILTSNSCLGIGVKGNDTCDAAAGAAPGYLDGYLNEVLIWDTALTPTQVASVSSCN